MHQQCYSSGLCGYLYCNGGVALAKMLHTLLSQRLKVTAMLVICCKMNMHKAVEVSGKVESKLT